MQSLALPLAYLGALLGVTMVLPQLIRTIRHPDLPGVSALSWSLTSLACFAWLIYGVRTATMPQIAGNVLLVSGAVAVVLLVPNGVARSRKAFALGGAAVTLLLVSLVIPPATVGYVAFGIGLLSAWPQLIESFGNWRSGGESGLSLTTWSVKIASTLCWLSYAIIATDVPVLVACAFGLTTTLTIFALETSARFAGTPAAERALERV